jgi:hypothetical protein
MLTVGAGRRSSNKLVVFTMDFIPPIANPAHPPLQVSSFGPHIKLYQPGGLETWLFYPHYEGFNVQHLVEGDFHGKTWAEAAGFFQRWAYWGMILEILQIGGLQGLEQKNWGMREDLGADRLQSFSASLPYLLLLWQCIHVDPTNPDKEHINQERFSKICVILKRVNLFYTLLCRREFSRRDKRDEDPGEPKAAQLLYARHSHQHEKPDDGGWDEYAKNQLGGKKSFFSEEPYSGDTPLESAGHALILSVGVAGELLCRATELKYNQKLDMIKWTIPITIIRRLNLAGWCPIWFRKLRDEGSVIRAYYLSSISRTPIDRHTRCCYFGCIASQVNALTYQMKHKTVNCTCQMVSFDLGEDSEHATWIRSGHVPLIIRAQDSTDSSLKWKLVRSEDETGVKKKYVAMSHVWVDGTGSTNGNSLFSCQLEKFQIAANQLYGSTRLDEPIFFWVDTICVPFNKGPLKMRAIQEMAQVYRNADKVLVFDSGLQKVTMNNPARECLTHIEISSWNERLWTIQEAVFAKALYFQFKDGIAGLRQLVLRYRLERFSRLGSLLHEIESETPETATRGMSLLAIILRQHLKPVLKGEQAFSKPPGIEEGEWLALDSDALKESPSETEMDGLILDTIFLGTVVAVSSFFNTLKVPEAGSEDSKIKWSSLEKALPYRQTSIASDEGLCISTLLGMDVADMFELPDEERVRLMFLHIGTINSGIMFGCRMRLELPGYRWMPSSFINQRLELSDKTAEVTESGVKVNFPSLFVRFPPGGFMLHVQPGNIDGNFGFFELDADREDGPGHLVAGAFPVYVAGTGRVWTVYLTLPEGSGGIVVSSQGMIIILEEELAKDDADTAPVAQSISLRVLNEWEQLRKKSIIEGFLVDRITTRRDLVEYSLPVTLVEFVNPTADQVEAAAFAIQSTGTDWLIT